MRHLYIVLLLSAFAATAQTPEKKERLFKFTGVSVYDGRTYYHGFSVGSPQSLKGMLPAGSPFPNITLNPTNNGSFNNTWASADNAFALYVGAHFMLNPAKAKGKGRHLFSAGIWHGNLSGVSADLRENTITTVDSITVKDAKFMIDSVNYKALTFTNEFNTYCADFTYQYSSNPEQRLSISIGFGLGMGATVANDYYGNYSEGYYHNLYDANDYYEGYYTNPENRTIIQDTVTYSIDDAGRSKAAFVLRPYIPLTLNFRVSNTAKFLKHLNVFVMLKGGVEYLFWNGANTKSMFHERSIGLKYTL